MRAATSPASPTVRPPQPGARSGARPGSGRARRRRARVLTLLVAGALAATACSSATNSAGDRPNGTNAGGGSGPAPVASPNLQLASALQPFSACDQLLDHVKKAALERVGPYGLRGSTDPMPGTVAEDADGSRRSPTTVPVTAPTTTARPAAPKSNGEGATTEGQSESRTDTPTAATNETTGQAPDAAHSETNVQEKGVDEPDTVKTDGKRILALANRRLVEVDVTGPAPVNAGSIALPGSGTGQILLSGDHVLVIDANAPMAEPVSSRPERAPVPGTLLTLIDIAKPAEMRILSNVRIDGTFVSARMVDGQARVVTTSTPAQLPFVNPSSSSALAEQASENANRRIVEDSKIEDWLPEAHIGNGTNPTSRPLLDCAKVSHPKTFSGFSVLAVVSLDVNAGEINPADAVGIMADGQTVYASKANLYVATPSYYDEPRNPSRVPGTGTVPTTAPPAPIPLRDATSIHKFSIEARGPAVYRASGDVDGTILNQYSMSEDEGALRVATTSAPASSRGCTRCAGTESFVRVLQETNGELQQVGQVGNLGRGEQIKAVRFVGKQGYVVTFRQTDPLYTLDLRDVRAPRVVGELKILGYSAYLHPMGDNLLVGIGQDATEQGRSLGTKVSLFDVADLANPRELQKYVLWNSTSEVEQDFHAFLYWEPTKLAMIPVDRAYVGFIGGDCPPNASGAPRVPTTVVNPQPCTTRQYVPPFTGAIGLTLDRNAITELGRVVNPASPGATGGCDDLDRAGTTGVWEGDCGSPCPPDAMCSSAPSAATTSGTAAPRPVDCSAQACAPAPTTTTSAPCPPETGCAPKPVPPICPTTPTAGVSVTCIPPATGARIERSLVIGDTLFTFSRNGIKSSALNDLHEEFWLPFTS